MVCPRLLWYIEGHYGIIEVTGYYAILSTVTMVYLRSLWYTKITLEYTRLQWHIQGFVVCSRLLWYI